ncbi:MAG TPA: adenine deaminase [Clostridiales bacterium UBA8960]|nr:adenine deaminase [Clostridiales bacterium UBA8960]
MKKRIDLAAGKRPASLVLKNCKIINVFNGKIIHSDIAIDHGKIIGIGHYEGEHVINLEGKFVAPGLIDAHMHMESTLVTPDQMARIIVPRGTTTVIADPHEIANVLGMEGVKYMIEATEETKLNGFFMLPSCVPATPYENAGATLDREALSILENHPKVLGLGEVMDYPSVINGNLDILEKLEMADRKIIDGHGPDLTGKMLNAYMINGIRTDHECTTLEEMEERIGLGMFVAIREGTAARNLDTLIKGVNTHTKHQCMFCTDDKHPEDILVNGHIDYHVRRAIALGVDPITAIQMATINPARCYNLRDIGAIAPGYDADLIVFDSFENFEILEVYKKGYLVAKNKTPLFEATRIDSKHVEDTVKISPISSDLLKLKLESDVAHVIRINPGSIVTEHVVRRVYMDEQGYFKTNKHLDIKKIAVIERHGKTKNVGIGLVENFHLVNGAIATTISHDSHNIIVVGDNDDDMAMAVNEIVKLQGGITIVSQGKVKGSLPLPIAGLMSSDSMEHVASVLRNLRVIANQELKIPATLEPFMTLSFLALPVIPELKITDRGYFDVKSFAFIDVSEKS